MSARFASHSNGRLMSRISPLIFAASAALASPGPIAAATSAGVDPSGISFTDPSGSAILNILVIVQAHVAAGAHTLNYCTVKWARKVYLTSVVCRRKASLSIEQGRLTCLERLPGSAITGALSG